MSPKLEILEGALILSDAHYSHKRPQLLALIEAIATHKIVCKQLILMGDIFDLLFGSIPYTYKRNSAVIALINTISKTIPVVYLEGNHDFNLKKVFPDAQVFGIKEQPVICRYGTKTVALAHGDFDGALGYKIYTALIRNPVTLFVLNGINRLFNNSIIERLDAYLEKKEDCNAFSGFENYIKKRSLGVFGGDFFIEGHYHQNKQLKFKEFTYVNLAAFACNQRYFIVKSLNDKEWISEEKL